MGLVLLACIPGLLATLWTQGWGVLFSLLLCAISALCCEATLLAMRRQPVLPALNDGSALVTAVLLAIALPGQAPWWVPVTAAGIAIAVGKQAFGGVGRNLFNPAMVGYAFVLLNFPLHMNHWPNHAIGFVESLQHAGFGNVGGRSSEWINLALLCGGLFLLQRKVISWHAPAGLLASLFLFSLLAWNGSGSDSNGSPLLHLFSGSTMLAAFFIATEPVSGPKANLARLLFGFGAGALIYLIRTWGSYPDGTAFAILLMNLAVPALDRFAVQRQQVSP
jgi:Na+-translocating ferredoxin:NAD+ oxidoreductase subunit D